MELEDLYIYVYPSSMCWGQTYSKVDQLFSLLEHLIAFQPLPLPALQPLPAFQPQHPTAFQPLPASVSHPLPLPTSLGLIALLNYGKDAFLGAQCLDHPFLFFRPVALAIRTVD
jgi:hypothetical protein